MIFLIIFLTITVHGQVDFIQNPTDFLPEGYVVFEKIYGDLNKDGLEDCVMVIKRTDKTQIITDEYRGQLDRNRRGIIVLFGKKSYFELVVQNFDCFSSESEDGGVYFAPELSIKIDNGNLLIHYGHGRYGHWTYTFKFQNSDFELIGYDESYRSNFIADVVTFDYVSINFINKKMLLKEIIKVTTDGKETFKETWNNFSKNAFIKLSEINDFDKLDMTEY